METASGTDPTKSIRMVSSFAINKICTVSVIRMSSRLPTASKFGPLAPKMPVGEYSVAQ